MASLGRQSEKRAAVEAAVLEATEALLAEGAPYAELNIERIATRAGISRTAFYFYFRDKRDLLMRLTSGVNAQLLKAAETWWTGASEIRAALERVARLYREHGALLRATVEVSTYDEEVAVFWRGLLGRFVEATEPRIGDRATAFALVWMTERTLYQQLVQGDAVDGEELLDALARIWAAVTP